MPDGAWQVYARVSAAPQTPPSVQNPSTLHSRNAIAAQPTHGLEIRLSSFRSSALDKSPDFSMDDSVTPLFSASDRSPAFST